MLLDLILMTAVVAVSIVGLQAVGLILMVALLITRPPHPVSGPTR